MDLRLSLAQSLQRLYFAGAYKGLLLSRVLEAARGEADVAGDPALRTADLMPQFGRFDTVYAHLAERMGLPLLRHSLDYAHLRRMEAQVVHRRLGAAEKLLSLLTNTPATFLVKLWRTLARRGAAPTLLGLPGGRRCWVYKDNELLDQSLFPLLLRGARVGHLPAVRPPDCPASAEPLPDEAAVETAFRECLAEHWAAQSAPDFAARQACADMLLTRTISSLRTLRASLPALAGYCEALAQPLRPGDTVLTNLLSGAVEFAFFSWLKHQGFRVASFEHGLTMGLARVMDWEARYASVRAGDVGMYHSRAAMAAVAPHAPGQEQVLAGLTQVARRVPLRPLSRLLARRMLGLPGSGHVVMYVADLDRNNAAHGPHVENDLQFAAKTRSALRALSRAFPDSTVLAKLYPTQRYVDCCLFADTAAEMPNVRLVRDMDFRFIRAAADLIVLSNAQSTLGWVAGAGCPAIFLEYPWAPVSLPGLALGDLERGLAAQAGGTAILLDCARLVERPEAGWAGRLLGQRKN